MKHILITILAGLMLIGCKEDKCKNKGSGNDDKEVCQELKEPEIEPIAEEPAAEPETIVKGPSYYGLHAYSAHDFESHLDLYWCTNGDCAEETRTLACQEILTFDDFTIYSETSATFYGSIPEPIQIDTELRQITLTSNTTGHIGKTFEYEYVPELESWIVTYGENCGRLYQYALSP